MLNRNDSVLCFQTRNHYFLCRKCCTKHIHVRNIFFFMKSKKISGTFTFLSDMKGVFFSDDQS